MHNRGNRPGGHVVQIYASRPAPGYSGAERVLLDFARVEVAAGGSHRVSFSTPLIRLSTRQGPGEWAVPPGEYRIEVASYAGDPDAGTIDVVQS